MRSSLTVSAIEVGGAYDYERNTNILTLHDSFTQVPHNSLLYTLPFMYHQPSPRTPLLLALCKLTMSSRRGSSQIRKTINAIHH